MPCDMLIAAAAVADYRPEVVASQKMKKDPGSDEGLTPALVRNPDILATLAAPRRPAVQRRLRRRDRDTCSTTPRASSRARTST